jgi:hypothetical protein
MKKLPILTALLFVSVFAHAQVKWAVDAGMGGAMAPHGDKFDHNSASNTVQPVVGARVLFRTPRPLVFGLSAIVERNKFDLDIVHSHSSSTFTHRSSYVSLAPVIGLSAGRHRNIQFNLLPSLSLLAGGKQQVTSDVYVGGQTGSEYDTSTHGIAVVRAGLGFEIQEQIPVNAHWRIAITESLKFYFNRITHNEYYPYSSIHANYWSLRVGIQHKTKAHQMIEG